jgi:hypothetical protein
VARGTQNHLRAGPGPMFWIHGALKLCVSAYYCPTKDMAQHLLALIPNAKSDYPPGHQAVTTSSSLQHHPRLHILPQSIPSDSSISVHVHTMGLSYWRPHLHPYGRTPSSHCSTGCKTRSVGPYVLRHRIFSIEPSPSVDYLFFLFFPFLLQCGVN